MALKALQNIPSQKGSGSYFFKYNKRAGESPSNYLLFKAREEVLKALESKEPRLKLKALRLLVKNKFLRTKRILFSAREAIGRAAEAENVFVDNGKKFAVFCSMRERAAILQIYEKNVRLFGNLKLAHASYVLGSADAGKMVIADVKQLVQTGLKIAACGKRGVARKVAPKKR